MHGCADRHAQLWIDALLNYEALSVTSSGLAINILQDRGVTPNRDWFHESYCSRWTAGGSRCQVETLESDSRSPTSKVTSGKELPNNQAGTAADSECMDGIVSRRPHFFRHSLTQ